MTVPQGSLHPISPTRLTFIGGGHLAEALLDGIYSGSPWATKCQIAITARRVERAEELCTKFPHALVTLNNTDREIWDNASSASSKHVLFLCTRPIDVPIVSKELANALAALEPNSRPTVVTMCPGITVQQLQSWLPPGTAVVRTMPNTPVECRQGATGMFASEDVSNHRVELVATALRDVSPAIALVQKEELLDVVAAISGSAPAHFYYLMEGLISAGESYGLAPDLARRLVTQSCLGAGQLARDATVPVCALRRGVCVPGGSTGKAIAHLEKRGFVGAVQAAVEKSLEANHQMRFVEK